MKAPWLLIPVLLTNSVIAAPATHCASGETVFFSCTVLGSEKVASLCGDADRTNAATWVQYRFGVLGHPEMIYPKKKEGSREKFFAHFESHPEGGFREIWFKVGGYRYLVASDQSEAQGAKVDNHIVVYKGWQPVANFECASTLVDNLYTLRDRILDANDNGFYYGK